MVGNEGREVEAAPKPALLLFYLDSDGLLTSFAKLGVLGSLTIAKFTA